jgi:hypothetical protein
MNALGHLKNHRWQIFVGYLIFRWCGMTMLAKGMPTIIPPLTLEVALETSKMHSVAAYYI